MWVCGWVVISMAFTSCQVHSLVGRVTSVFYVVYTNWSVKFACRLPCCFYPCLTIRNSKHKNEGFNMAKFVPQCMFLFFFYCNLCKPKSRGGGTTAAKPSGVLAGSAAVPSKYGWTAEPFGSWQGEKFGDARSPPWKPCPHFSIGMMIYGGSSVDQNKFHSSFGSLVPSNCVFCFSTVFSSKQFNMFHILFHYFTFFFGQVALL